MIEIKIDELVGDVSRVPADEYFADAEEGDMLLMIEIDENCSIFLLEEDAEQLYRKLGEHFRGLIP